MMSTGTIHQSAEIRKLPNTNNLRRQWRRNLPDGLPTYARFIFTILAELCPNADGTGIFVGIDTLMAETGMGRRMVGNALKELTYHNVVLENGWHRNAGGSKTRQRRINVALLTVQPSAQCTVQPSAHDPRFHCAAECTQTVDKKERTIERTVETRAHARDALSFGAERKAMEHTDQGSLFPEQPKPDRKKRKWVPNPAFDAEFAAFWERYPSRENNPPAEARKSYEGAREDTSAEEILAGLARYEFSEVSKFRPMAATWLNQRRWECPVVDLGADPFGIEEHIARSPEDHAIQDYLPEAYTDLMFATGWPETWRGDLACLDAWMTDRYDPASVTQVIREVVQDGKPRNSLKAFDAAVRQRALFYDPTTYTWRSMADVVMVRSAHGR